MSDCKHENVDVIADNWDAWDYGSGTGVAYQLLKCEDCGIELCSCNNGSMPKAHLLWRPVETTNFRWPLEQQIKKEKKEGTQWDRYTPILRTIEDRPMLETDPEFRAAHQALHHLWTKAVGTPNYHKEDWDRLDRAISALAKRRLKVSEGTKRSTPEELSAEAKAWDEGEKTPKGWVPSIDAIPRAKEKKYDDCFRSDTPPDERIRTAAADMHGLLNQECTLKQLQGVIGIGNWHRAHEYLDCIVTNLERMKETRTSRIQRILEAKRDAD